MGIPPAAHVGRMSPAKWFGLLLVALVGVAGVAAAQSLPNAPAVPDLPEAGVEDAAGAVDAYVDPESHGEGDATVTTDEAAAAAEGGLYSDGNYGDLDAGAATDHASGAVDADGSASDLEDAPEGGFWTWLQIGLRAVLASIGDALGVDEDVSESADANVEVFASDQGVDLDATADVAGHAIDFDASEAGGLDGQTWETMGQVRALKGEAEGLVPS